MGSVVAWAAFAAAGFDYLENLGLAVSIWDEPMSPWPEIALFAATTKFALIALALVYSLSGIGAWLVGRRPVAAG